MSPEPTREGSDGAPPETRAARTPLEGRRLIFAGLAAFAVVGVTTFALGAFFAPDVEAPPGFPIAEVATPGGGGTFRLTLDVADRDHWIPVDLRAGRLVAGVEQADLAARRYVLRAPHGAADLGPGRLEDAPWPRTVDWDADAEVDGAFQNPALADWYDYSYWTHLLESRGHVYALRRRDGGIALVELVSYYCEPEGSGCLTLRYRLD